MNRDQIEGNWKQLKGNIQKWAKLTDDDSEGGMDGIGNTMHANKFGYDDTLKDNSANTLRNMQDGSGDASNDNEASSDGAGIPCAGEFAHMDDSGNLNSNHMPDDLDELTHARSYETPHQEKSLDHIDLSLIVMSLQNTQN